MNQEDLILDTQISELKRLQTSCIKARGAIEKIQSLTVQLSDQAVRGRAEIQTRQNNTTQAQIERVEAEAKKLREQAANPTASQSQATRAASAEKINALNSQLKKNIADCQHHLQEKISWLRSSEEHANTLLNTEPQADISTNETNNDLPEFEFAEPETKISNDAVPTHQTEVKQQLSELEQKAQEKIQKKNRPRSKASSSLPPAKLESTLAESGTSAITERMNLALDSAEQFSDKKPAIWGRGLPLLILSLLFFCIGTVASALLKVDLSSLMSFELSEADLAWLGMSCGVGLALTVIAGSILRKLASRGVKQVTHKILSHTSNATVMEEQWKRNGEAEDSVTSTENSHTLETRASPIHLLQNPPEENSNFAKPELKKYDHQRAAEMQAAANEQVNDLVSRYAEQIAQHFAQLEDQNLQSKSESGEVDSSVENWRNKELARIQNHSAATLEQALSKLAYEVQTKQDQLSTEAASSLTRWKANVLVASEVARISCNRATQFPAWEHLCSMEWTAPSSLPATLTVGDLQVMMPVAPDTIEGKLESELNIQLPGLLNFPRDASIAIEHDADGRKPALDFVRAMVLRLLTSIPPGQVQFTLIDPVSPDRSFSGLTRLAQYNEQLIDGQVWSDSSQIELSLQKVNARMERVLKAFLESGANSIDEHNAMSADNKEPYHFVVVAGFPKDFTDDAARSLTSIVTGGALCGVHAIVIWSPDETLPKSFETDTLQKSCAQFHVKNGAVQPGRSLATNNPYQANELVEFVAVKPPGLKVYETVVSAVGEKSRPVKPVKETVVEDLAADAQPGPPEPPLATLIAGDAVNATAEQVSEVSASAEQPIVVSDSSVETAVTDSPVAESQTIENSVKEQPAMAQGIAEIPATQSHENDSSDVTVAVVEAPIVESPPLEHTHVIKDDVDHQASTPEIEAIAAVAPTIDHCASLNAKLADESAEPRPYADGIPVWIGESNNNVTAYHKFHRARGQNTLIVGQNEDLADAVFASTILSLCAGRASGHTQSAKVVLVHDGVNQESLRKFAASFSDTVTPRFAMRSAAGVDALVAELLEEMIAREKNRAAKNTPEIVFAVRNVGQFPSLRRDYENAENASAKSSKSTPAVPRFVDLLRQGPRVGIHVLMWANTFETALQCLSNSLLREFDTRIALTMNSQDSTSLISRPDAELIDADSAILYSEQTGSAHQFRPFAWPSVEWLSTLPQAATTASNEASQISVADIASTDPEVQPVESSEDDGFTVAADVVVTETAIQPTTSETSSGDFETNATTSNATIAIPDVPVPLLTKGPGTPTAPEKVTSKSKPSAAPAKSKSAKGSKKPAASVPAFRSPDSENPTKAAPSPPNVVASANAAPQKATQAPPEKRPSGMAMRMSSRNSDPLRPLDAPPEQREVPVASDQPTPDAEFDEMDFDSLLIE